ncbi:delta-1-pyrroline-5-carboxylate dehydrogenase, mitochondrial-like [Panonychus citri]|uniref:delta-1-pyrroline-5-carboxylate dehydrogenase, mitochondrial-like n=1 Tax=Panonychus citri TaxID=50023 RepID=UPI0023073CDD|nr:delta-1-pyrroline-5-carboxylate dehydrogenase, mitochondrial-like [Panonychus citri]
MVVNVIKRVNLLNSPIKTLQRLPPRTFTTVVSEKIEDFTISNEPLLSYLSNSKERKALQESLAKLSTTCYNVPIVINGQEFTSDHVKSQVMPFDHSKSLAKYYWATPELLNKAIETSLERREKWEQVPLKEKIHIFLRAADLVATKYRYDLLAATMLGQGKTVFQAEIDAAGEFADFLRFNAFFAKEMIKYQPISENPSVLKNSFRYRGIEGFIAAISPFNFTAIGGNLASAPTLMGNVVLWKPSDTAILSNYLSFKILQEAGVPPGVINFVPSDGPVFGDSITSSRWLAGINFTGSVGTFKHLWKQTASNLDVYLNYPRLVGECGGKNYHFVHSSADVVNVSVNSIRSAFEYSGQKCSACSRLYVPKSKWPEIKSEMLKIINEMKVSSPLEFDSFTSSVIDEKAFNRIRGYIDHARESSSCQIIAGGEVDKSIGYFIKPTIIECNDLNDRLFNEEIFGPVLAVYQYEDSNVQETLRQVHRNTHFALTGAIFGQDPKFLQMAAEELKMSAGNFYINDKSTGAVVGQQPFGGSRLSGTNDKAGGPHYLLRWTSPQTIKESFINQREWKYPYMT